MVFGLRFPDLFFSRAGRRPRLQRKTSLAVVKASFRVLLTCIDADTKKENYYYDYGYYYYALTSIVVLFVQHALAVGWASRPVARGNR